MIRFYSSLILFCALVDAPLLAANRTLVAEGEYVQRTKDGTVPYDHWRLWQESDSTFSAEVESAKLPAFAQTFYFDSKFLPSGYSLTVTRQKESDKIGMTCHQKNDTLSCESSFEGKTSSTSTRVSGPCLVTVDEAPGLDFLWAFAAILRMPSAGTPNPICGYVLKEETLGAISLKSNSSSERIVLASEQTAEILGKHRTVRTYEVGNNDLVTWGEIRGKNPTVHKHVVGHNDIWIIKVLHSGIVVSMSIKDASDGGFELAEYREYRQWAP
jgi:hypothetical protein